MYYTCTISTIEVKSTLLLNLVSPTSPLMPSSPLSLTQVTPDTPTFSASMAASPSQQKQRRHKNTKSIGKKRSCDCLCTSPARNSRTSLSESDSEPVESLIVSIPTQNMLHAKQQCTAAEMDPLNIDFTAIEASPGTMELCSNFSTAVSAIMAEPVPSTCIQTRRHEASLPCSANNEGIILCTSL